MAENDVGQVSSYFAKIGVAGIECTDDVRVGDTLRFKGHTTDFTQRVECMQIEREDVEQAGAGDSIGIKVAERCRKGDQVFKVTE